MDAVYRLDEDHIIIFSLGGKSYKPIATNFSVIKRDVCYASNMITRVEAIRLLRSFIIYNLNKEDSYKEWIQGRIRYAKRLRDKLAKENAYANLVKREFIEFYYPIVCDDVIDVSSMSKILDAYDDFVQSETF